jgi:predicted TIM-barrel fold metal-dependent hydrolase
VDHAVGSDLGPLIDCNVHLWDQESNPVFWLSDRTLVRDMIGDYDSLPDTYTLADYRQETRGHDIAGVVWSDAGAADPIAAVDWVAMQSDHLPIIGMVTLGDPASTGFAELIELSHRVPLVTSMRMRLVEGMSTGGLGGEDFLEDPLIRSNLEQLATKGLVATIEATADRLDVVVRIAERFPDLRIVVDHFGWPTDLSEGGRAEHLERLAPVAAMPSIDTRIDAIGTIFGNWTVATVRPWLLEVAELFGPERCMLGSDIPIERLRSSFTDLYSAYGDIFSGASEHERALLFHGTARRCYGT